MVHTQPAPVSLQSKHAPHSQGEYDVYSTFQSHEPEFDYLKSLEIEEKINKIKWLPQQNAAHSLLSTNGKGWPLPTCPRVFLMHMSAHACTGGHVCVSSHMLSACTCMLCVCTGAPCLCMCAHLLAVPGMCIGDISQSCDLILAKFVCCKLRIFIRKIPTCE